jgi:hypothetical protein
VGKGIVPHPPYASGQPRENNEAPFRYWFQFEMNQHRLFQAALFIFREQPILQLRDAVKNSQEHLNPTVTVGQQHRGLWSRPHYQSWPERTRLTGQ